MWPGYPLHLVLLPLHEPSELWGHLEPQPCHSSFLSLVPSLILGFLSGTLGRMEMESPPSFFFPLFVTKGSCVLKIARGLILTIFKTGFWL